MASDSPQIRYLIQIDRSGGALDIEQARLLLEPLGIFLDVSYGPVCINRKLGRYVVRGGATSEARHKAEQIAGIRFFADAKVGPTGPPIPHGAPKISRA